MSNDNKISCTNLKYCAELAIFICICIIISLSSKDPFQSYYIGNLTNYFNIPLNDTSSNESLYNIKKLEYLYKKDNSSLNQYFLKRKLKSHSFCGDMKEIFARNIGRKLSYVFNLNYKVIRRLSIAILVVSLSYIVLYIIIIIFNGLQENTRDKINEIFKRIKEKEEKKDCPSNTIENINISTATNDKINDDEKSLENFRRRYGIFKKILIPIKIITILVWIAKFVLSLLLYHFIENGDIEKYEDFLDCKGVKVDFFDRFSDIKKLKRVFLAFAILNIIGESLDKCEEFPDLNKK